MRRTGLVAALTITTGTSGAHAATLDFTFAFTNTPYGGGTVQGVIRGLATDGDTAATSVEVTSNTAGSGLGEYNSEPLVNEFTVSNGELLLFNFASLGENNQNIATNCCSLFLEGGVGGETTAGFSSNPAEAQANFDTGITFKRLETAEPAPVPLPVPGLLLAAALCALLGLRAARRGAATA